LAAHFARLARTFRRKGSISVQRLAHSRIMLVCCFPSHSHSSPLFPPFPFSLPLPRHEPEQLPQPLLVAERHHRLGKPVRTQLSWKPLLHERRLDGIGRRLPLLECQRILLLSKFQRIHLLRQPKHRSAKRAVPERRGEATGNWASAGCAAAPRCTSSSHHSLRADCACLQVWPATRRRSPTRATPSNSATDSR